MKRLITALMALLLGVIAPHAAHATESYTSEQLGKGGKDAPAIVQKTGVPCTISAAAYIDTSSTKEGNADKYEVACEQGLGYILMSTDKGVKAYDCLAMLDQSSQACKLPANANPAVWLAGVAAAAKVTCTPSKGRYVGSAARIFFYEVACREGPGYVFEVPTVGAATTPTVALPCLQTEGRGIIACTLTTKAQDQAVVQALVTKSGKTCQVSSHRFIGTDGKTAASYLEVGCGTQPGFILVTTPTGAFDHVIPCIEAQGLGGCTLTNMTALNTEVMATYTQDVKAAGFDCTVNKFRVIGADSDKNQIVELACANRSDGAVVSMPVSSMKKVRVYDCVTSAVFGNAGACLLSSKAAVYARYNMALSASGLSQCMVNDARYAGKLGNGDSYVEVACTDGGPGWLADFTQAGVAKDVLSCGQTKPGGVSCQLSGPISSALPPQEIAQDTAPSDTPNENQPDIADMQAMGAMARNLGMSIGSAMNRGASRTPAASYAAPASPRFNLPPTTSSYNNRITLASNSSSPSSVTAQPGSTYRSHPELVSSSCVTINNNGVRVVAHNRCSYQVDMTYCALAASNVSNLMTCQDQGAGSGTITPGGDMDVALNMNLAESQTPGPHFQIRFFACRSDTGALIKVASWSPLEGECMAWSNQ